MADLSQPNNPYATTPDDHLNRLLVKEVEEPWYKTFIQNVKDAINPPKLPPLEVTSKPIAVKEIWGLYGRDKKSWMMSTGLQSLAVVAVVILGATPAVQQKVKETVTLIMPTDLAPPPPIPPPEPEPMPPPEPGPLDGGPILASGSPHWLESILGIFRSGGPIRVGSIVSFAFGFAITCCGGVNC